MGCCFSTENKDIQLNLNHSNHDDDSVDYIDKDLTSYGLNLKQEIHIKNPLEEKKHRKSRSRKQRLNNSKINIKNKRNHDELVDKESPKYKTQLITKKSKSSKKLGTFNTKDLDLETNRTCSMNDINQVGNILERKTLEKYNYLFSDISANKTRHENHHSEFLSTAGDMGSYKGMNRKESNVMNIMIK